MPLKDMLEDERRICKLTRTIEQLSEEDQITLAEWMDTLPAYKIARLLHKYGHPISETTMVKHLRKACLCYTNI